MARALGRTLLTGEHAQASLRGRPRGRLGRVGLGKGCLRGRPRGRLGTVGPETAFFRDRLGCLGPTGCATSCTSQVKWLESVFDGIRVFCDEETLLCNYKQEWNKGRSQEVDKGSFPS